MDLGFEVTDLPETDHVAVGDDAPEFTRPLVGVEFWEDRSFADLVAAEGPLLFVTHPMDGAFPTTYVWNELRDRGLTERLPVVGCSVSSPYEHRDLLADRGVDARVFSDPDAGVASAYGVEHDLDGMAGVTEHRLATFLVDADREVRHAWVASRQPDFPDYDALAAAVDDLV
jgi:peroxiredoxin